MFVHNNELGLAMSDSKSCVSVLWRCNTKRRSSYSNLNQSTGLYEMSKKSGPIKGGNKNTFHHCMLA